MVNSILVHYLIAFMLMALITGTEYLMMRLISTKAKLTPKRIIQWITCAILVFVIQAVLFNDWEIFNALTYLVVVNICFLFKEKQILTKIWKVVIVVAMNATLEFNIAPIVDWLYDSVWSNWFIYYFAGSVIVFLMVWASTSIVKRFDLYSPTECESIIYSKTEGVLLCILALCIDIQPSIGYRVCETPEFNGLGQFYLSLWITLSTLSFMVLVLGIDKNFGRNYYTKVNELIETQFKDKVKYYEKMEEGNKEIRGIRHDMKNHLIGMEGLLKENKLEELQKYISNIKNNVENKVVLVTTGNTIVDAIFNEKHAVANEKQINMDIKVGVDGNIDMEFIDLCIILSNSIDNAIEACERIENPAQRKISIKCTYTAGYFLYDITNTMKEENVSKVKNKVLTIKKDKKNHGFGLGNIKQSVEKYDGTVTTSCNNFQFKLQVEINTKSVKTLQA